MTTHAPTDTHAATDATLAGAAHDSRARHGSTLPPPPLMRPQHRSPATAPAGPPDGPVPAMPPEPPACDPEHAPSEHLVQNKILRVFGTRPDIRVWRANCGVAVMGAGPAARKVRFGVPGQADISGIIAVVPISVFRSSAGQAPKGPYFGAVSKYPGDGPVFGLRLEIEVKSRAGRQSNDQRAWQAMITKFGGLYVLARSVDDVHAALEEAIDGYQR